uniref:Uncharacterized protein n=1 Tax=Anguilla anguilla TaxID=7936 RepID=A0A0E9PUI9_ANGAN
MKIYDQNFRLDMTAHVAAWAGFLGQPTASAECWVGDEYLCQFNEFPIQFQEV